MKKILISTLFLIVAIQIFAQKFPIPVRSGDTLQIVKADAIYNVPVKDTLWILKNSQFQNALIIAKKNELCEEEVLEYKGLVDLLKEQGAEKDSLTVILKKDRDYYQNIWKTCDEDIVKMGKIQKRQSLYTKISLICIPVALVIGILLPI